MKPNWTAHDMPDQSGKSALITGANDGLGLQVTRELVRKNAAVVMACRNVDKAQTVREEVRRHTPGATLDVIGLDLGDLQSVNDCGDEVSRRYDRLDIVLCNAGLMGQYIGVSGLGENRGSPKITRAQKGAYDPVLRQRLWSVSEEATGVMF